MIQQVAFLREVGLRNGSSNHFVLRTSRQFDPCWVHQDADTIRVDDADSVWRCVNEIAILLFAFSSRTFRSFARGDVVVRLEDSYRLFRFIALQRPSTRYRDLGAIAAGMNQFSFPPASLEQDGIYFLERRWEGGLGEFVSDTADGLFARPTVAFLGASIPVGDNVVHVADEDGVVREIEETCLLL